MPGRKLTAAFVQSVKRAGKYGDQHGLILRVRRTGSKQWIWRGTVGGRRVDLGLGGYPYTTLREARDRAFEYRRAARSGRHPKALSGSVPTFSEAVERVIEMHRTSWRPGSGSEEEWRRTLRLYAIPRLGAMLVSEISTADIMAVLQPIWGAKAVTARRVRQRIGAVMRWAIAQGYRGDNPAGESVTAALPRNATQPEHFRALPHGEVAAMLAKVRQSDAGSIARLSLEFLVLTAARAGEVRHARWAEIDRTGRVWRIPASRMKARREHRVPLARRALEVLEEARNLGDGSALIFPSSHTGRTLSSGVWWKLLRRLDLDCTVHGFRSSFRDWCGESGVPREVAEACLAHAIGNQAEAAYARSDLLERRRRVMEEWDRYTDGNQASNLR
ncbi:MAG: tyrosine-type recombinase/integrase [Acidobacteria bacterium]|nr:tyrosine-type recombinase/integrase [Acidobacteriota bacterium]MCY3970280.1 tyrosine-type recombinase/integrase [Acidobacteriota bacterium]